MKKYSLLAAGFVIAAVCMSHIALAATADPPPPLAGGLLDAALGWVFAHLGSFVHNLNARLNTKSPQAAEIATIAENAALAALTKALQALPAKA